MKTLILTLLFSFSTSSAFAAVEFRSGRWNLGLGNPAVLETVALTADGSGSRVILNFAEDRQIILSGEHAAVGLALVNYQGQCIKVMPKSNGVSFILKCE